MMWGGADEVHNKVHNKCNALDSSQNYPPWPQTLENLPSTKLVPGAKKIGDTTVLQDSERPLMNKEVEG